MTDLSIAQTIERALAAAGLDTTSGPIARATATIRKALTDAGLAQADDAPNSSTVLEPAPAPAPSTLRPTPEPERGFGRFTNHTYSSAQGSRHYKLYVPAAYAGTPMPLIVMLHGCTQNPDDFAAGTRMNQLAHEHGFLVAYPAQSARANAKQCWNWFDSAQQARGGEEPAVIAGIVAEVAAGHAIDARQVFVAGLSAGAAMAVILGATYPEVFAGVAAHSGVPLGSAHDMPSAFAAMHGRPAGAQPSSHHPTRGVRTIVLHGDADKTVTRSNGQAIAQQAVRAFERSGVSLQAQHGLGAVCGGKECTTTHYLDAAGVEQVQHWVVHGGSHAWFGGSAKGSYTDTGGPDASAQIVQFFLARRA